MGLREKIDKFPDTPGVYVMKNISQSVVYVGKATSLKERVRSYFVSDVSPKTRRQMQEVVDIDFIETDSALEALFLESKLIRRYSPKYNIKEKDDKSRIYVYFTKEDFPLLMLIRETDLGKIKEKNPILYGPFLSTRSVLNALELIRKIIPYRSCKKMPVKKCLYGAIGLCDAPCEGIISQGDYMKNIRRLRDFFEGKKQRIFKSLNKEMLISAKNQQFEKAAKLRDQLNALEHLKQAFVISRDDVPTIFHRIEGYDISNISGVFAVGSMVVFVDGFGEKSEYRKFKIKWVRGANDIAMMKEVLIRRFTGKLGRTWDMPDLILIDGGRGQVNAAIDVLKKINLDIPVVGLAKGADRKKDELITSRTIPRGEINLFKQVRDESHRFAQGYYRQLHRSLNTPQKT